MTDKDQLDIPNEHPDAQSVGEKYRKFGFLPGGYICRCESCASRFIGAKRSFNCLDCARILDAKPEETKDQSPFEGVIAEIETVTVQHERDHTEYQVCQLRIGDRIKEFANIDRDHYEQIAERWNAHEGLKHDVERYVNLSAELENENQRLKDENEAKQKSIDYYSDLSQQWQEKYEAASKEKTYYVDTDPDQMDTTEAIKAVKLLKEENERLKGELQCFEGEKELYEESNEDLQSKLSEAQERIEFLENDAKNQSALSKAGEAWAEEDYKKLQAELSSARERIEELEKPDIFHDYKTCEISPGYPMLWELMEDKKGVVEVVRSKDLGNKFCIWIPSPDNEDERGYVKEFNTLEEAQQAIEGEE